MSIDIGESPSVRPTDEELYQVDVALKNRNGTQNPGLFPIGCRAGYNFNRHRTSDALPVFTSRTRHVMPYGASEIALVYAGGFAGVAEVESAYFSGIHIGLAPVWGAPSGNSYSVDAITRVTKKGKFNLAIPSGEVGYCDSIGVSVDRGGAIGLQFYGVGSTAVPVVGGRETARGKTWGGEFAKVESTGTSDLSLSQSGWATVDNNARASHTPSVILGRTKDGIRRSSVAIIGHSIPYGEVSGGGLNLRDSGDDDGNYGWIERTINSKRPFSSFCAPGDQLRNWLGVNNANALAANYAGQRLSMLSLGFSDCILQLEINDFGPITVDQYEQIFRSMVRKVSGLGIKVHAVTPFPQTSSSDLWLTTVNQSKSTKSDMIVDWSNRLRDNGVSWGCSSIIDANLKLRDSVDSWKWRTDIVGSLGASPTLDGTHPTESLNSWISQQSFFDVDTLIPEFPR